MFAFAVKLPFPSVEAVPMAALSKVIVMDLLAPKPLPETCTWLPTFPELGLTPILLVMLKAAVAELVPSLAVMVWAPPGKDGTVKLVLKFPFASDVGCVNCVPSILTVIVALPLNALPVTLIESPTLPELAPRVILDTMVKVALADTMPSLAVIVGLRVVPAGTTNVTGPKSPMLVVAVVDGEVAIAEPS